MKTVIIYLLHFDKPYKHAKHYMGSCNDLDARIAQHRAGNGARLTAVIARAGIGFQVARTWKGDKRRERKMKGRGLSWLCPICKQQQRSTKQ